MKALMLRAQYMSWSLQKFPRVAARCLRMLIDEDFVPALIDDSVLNEILRGHPSATSQGRAPSVSKYDYIIVCPKASWAGWICRTP